MNSSPKRSAMLLAVVTFFVGVACTIVTMTIVRGNAPSPSVAALEKIEDKEADHDEHKKELAVVSLSPEGVNGIGIRVRPVTYQNLRESLRVPATVEASQSGVAKITPPVAGKIVQVLVRLGESVRVGQPLAVLDSFEVAQTHAAERQAEAQVRQAEAGVQTAQAEEIQARGRQASAEKSVATQRELAQAGAFSQAPLQTAQSELSEAQSELITAQTERQSHETAFLRTERLFKEGIISRAELETAQLERAQDQNRVDRLQARVDIAKQILLREKRVAEAGLLNRQAVQAAEAEVRATAGEVMRARRMLDAARTTLMGAREALVAAKSNLAALEGAGGHAEGDGGRVVLFAPISGTVSNVDASLGETVERSSTLFQIDNLNTVIVQANVPERDISRVRSGLKVEVTVAAYPKAPFTGVIQSIASRLDEKTHALPVRCLVANPDRRLRPEMFATVSLPLSRSRKALAVPANAIVTERKEDDGNKQVVFVAHKEVGKYEKRRITTAGLHDSDGMVEIATGLKAGEQVVIEGAYTLLSELNKAELSEEGHAH